MQINKNGNNEYVIVAYVEAKKSVNALNPKN